MTTGTFAADRIPDLDAGKIASGTVHPDRLPNVNSGASGTMTPAQLAMLEETYGYMNDQEGEEGSETTICHIELLWSRASVDTYLMNAFEAQTITLPAEVADKYQLLLFVYNFSTSVTTAFTSVVEIVGQAGSRWGHGILSVNASTVNRTGGRDVLVHVKDGQTEIMFMDAAYNGSSPNNNYAIPNRIYGIRGVRQKFVV